MKFFSIFFCILTIIMLSALAASIIKVDDKMTSNKEKRYMLLCIVSFIILMISSIISTLGNNTLSILLIIMFIIFILLSLISYFNCKNKRKYTKPLIPQKLKKNLKVLKNFTDGYRYKVETELVCCDQFDFEVKSLKEDGLHIVDCICSKCNKEYEVYNSELDGYRLELDNEIRILKKDFKNKRCSKCHRDLYNVIINYEYIDNIEEVEEARKLGETDIGNLFISLKMHLSCKECNKKEKDFINYETR